MSISFDNVTLGYDLHPAVHHRSLEIKQGSMVALVGPNGAGKSTLLKGIMGQLKSLGGLISLGQLNHSQIAYLPQLSQVDRSFPITVREMVALGAWGVLGAFKSVSEEQRVLFARLLLQKTELILLDEPFTGVDARTSADLITQIKRWQTDVKTIVAVLHDLHQVKAHFPTTLLLSRRAIAYGHTNGVLTEENLQRASQFNEAFDDHAEPCVMVGEH